LNMAAATLYRERFGDTPGIVYAAGVDHAYNLAIAFRAAGIKAEAVSGRTPPTKLAQVLAAYERGEIDVLINAMLLAEGWNAPQAHARAVARASDARRRAPARSHPARVAARRPEIPRRGRAAVLGDDRRTANALRRAGDLRAEVHRERRDQGGARDVPFDLRR